MGTYTYKHLGFRFHHSLFLPHQPPLLSLARASLAKGVVAAVALAKGMPKDTTSCGSALAPHPLLDLTTAYKLDEVERTSPFSSLSLSLILYVLDLLARGGRSGLDGGGSGG